MNKITFPLKPDMQDTEVGDLQDGLQLLLDKSRLLEDDVDLRNELSCGLKKERDDQSYGSVTGQLVRYFQDEYRLEVNESIVRHKSENITLRVGGMK